MSIFESFLLQGRAIKNHLLISSFSDNQAEKGGKISRNIFENLVRFTKQGVGSLILDSAYVCNQGRGSLYQLGISEEEHLPGLKNLVRVLKEDSVFVGIRLSHAGARTNLKLCGEQPISPSTYTFGKDYDTSREFDSQDIKEVCTYFAHAAERAEEAGFDFVELNLSQNLLLAQCLSPYYNQREDNYGGSLQNRLRLAVEILDVIKKRTSSLLVSFYFSTPFEWEEDILKAQAELLEMLKVFESSKVDILHPVLLHVVNKAKETEVPLASLIRKATRLPLIIDGNIKSSASLKDSIQVGDYCNFYRLDKSVVTRQNWFQYLQKKIN